MSTNMLIHRLSQVGRWMTSELKLVQALSLFRKFHFCPNYRRMPPNHFCQQTKHSFSATIEHHTSDNQENMEKAMIRVTFIDKDGEEKLISVPVGMSMLEAAIANDIELEGTCEGSLACSTCHVIVMDMEFYNKLEDPVDEENDMLDLAFGLCETSRLGCQIIAKPELDGMRLALPAATRNLSVDRYVANLH